MNEFAGYWRKGLAALDAKRSTPIARSAGAAFAARLEGSGEPVFFAV